MTAALTFGAIQANKGHYPGARDRGHQLRKQHDDIDLGPATNSRTAPLGDQEAMMKATTRPCHVGWLANHHRAYNAATTDTVAPRHTIP
jgi:hypothetical protein